MAAEQREKETANDMPALEPIQADWLKFGPFILAQLGVPTTDPRWERVRQAIRDEPTNPQWDDYREPLGFPPREQPSYVPSVENDESSDDDKLNDTQIVEEEDSIVYCTSHDMDITKCEECNPPITPVMVPVETGEKCVHDVPLRNSCEDCKKRWVTIRARIDAAIERHKDCKGPICRHKRTTSPPKCIGVAMTALKAANDQDDTLVPVSPTFTSASPSYTPQSPMFSPTSPVLYAPSSPVFLPDIRETSSQTSMPAIKEEPKKEEKILECCICTNICTSDEYCRQCSHPCCFDDSVTQNGIGNICPHCQPEEEEDKEEEESDWGSEAEESEEEECPACEQTPCIGGARDCTKPPRVPLLKRRRVQ